MPNNTALVFLDTETTGLSSNDEIWEFAAIRREPDGSERELHLFLEHDAVKCMRLPEIFLDDHQRRFPSSHTSKWHPDVVPRWKAASLIAEFLDSRPHIVGAVPSFDTGHITRLCETELREEGWSPTWHYHLIDVENVALGWLNGKGAKAAPPYRSDDLASACGVEPASEGERHTALGDARWVMRWYDAMLGGSR